MATTSQTTVIRPYKFSRLKMEFERCQLPLFQCLIWSIQFCMVMGVSTFSAPTLQPSSWKQYFRCCRHLWWHHRPYHWQCIGYERCCVIMIGFLFWVLAAFFKPLAIERAACLCLPRCLRLLHRWEGCLPWYHSLLHASFPLSKSVSIRYTIFFLRNWWHQCSGCLNLKHLSWQGHV